MRTPDPKLLYSARPVMLVVDPGDDGLRDARERGGRRGASTAMVNDCSHAFEQSLLIDLVDRPAVGPVIDD